MNKRNEKIEFKVKLAETWEGSPILCTKKIRISHQVPEINAFAQKLANMIGKEVCWQFAWGSQGHYIQPQEQTED